MFRNNYYCLVAGLKEYAFDTEAKGFDAPAIIDEVKEGVSARDRRRVELFYRYWDIRNLLDARAGRERFSPLGNLSREEIAAAVDDPSLLPAPLARIASAYRAAERDGADAADDDVDTDGPIEGALFGAYYRECERSGCRFLKRWAEFDRTMRNVSAALAARRLGVAPAEAIVGEGDVESALARSSAADFGLRGEVGYLEQVMAAASEGGDMLDKERRMDEIRWNMADELTSMNYFDIDFLLGYLAKVNIIYRWSSLDAESGRRMLERLSGELTAERAGSTRE